MKRNAHLILAKPGHEGCRVFPVSTLDQVIAYFLGSGKLQNALKDGIQFEDYIPKAPDFGQIRGQKRKGSRGYLCRRRPQSAPDWSTGRRQVSDCQCVTRNFAAIDKR